MKKSTIISLILIIAGFLIGYGLGTQKQSPAGQGEEKKVEEKAGKEEIKIGALFPLTGDVVGPGQNARAAVEIAVEEVNKQGGINGSPLKVIYEDSKCNAK